MVGSLTNPQKIANTFDSLLHGNLSAITIKKYHIQSAYRMENDAKVAQEEASLRNIGDSFKKIVIAGQHTPVLRNDAGITTISICDFLLNPNSLEL